MLDLVQASAKLKVLEKLLPLWRGQVRVSLVIELIASIYVVGTQSFSVLSNANYVKPH